eukprot:TRINITY_DN1422_c0_g1_i1.p1 TRINITY_DN1422_c0_g1~~TRINITY_DN1422_c0_g1_i1.p1  ORF type:complete len:402 (+),score=134.94 TRINITY_DN1422_c0_g1_i1:56-1207(+)
MPLPVTAGRRKPPVSPGARRSAPTARVGTPRSSRVSERLASIGPAGGASAVGKDGGKPPTAQLRERLARLAAEAEAAAAERKEGARQPAAAVAAPAAQLAPPPVATSCGTGCGAAKQPRGYEVVAAGTVAGLCNEVRSLQQRLADSERECEDALSKYQDELDRKLAGVRDGGGVFALLKALKAAEASARGATQEAASLRSETAALRQQLAAARLQRSETVPSAAPSKSRAAAAQTSETGADAEAEAAAEIARLRAEVVRLEQHLRTAEDSVAALTGDLVRAEADRGLADQSCDLRQFGDLCMALRRSWNDEISAMRDALLGSVERSLQQRWGDVEAQLARLRAASDSAASASARAAPTDAPDWWTAPPQAPPALEPAATAAVW